MTATDEPRIHTPSADSRRARRRVEEVSFDDLIADIDAPVTEAPASETPAPAPKPARTHANAEPTAPARSTAPAPAPAPAESPAPAPATRRDNAAEPEHPKGRFYRPELYSTTQRITGSLVVKITAVVLLLAGTAALVYLAFDRFS